MIKCTGSPSSSTLKIWMIMIGGSNLDSIAFGLRLNFY